MEDQWIASARVRADDLQVPFAAAARTDPDSASTPKGAIVIADIASSASTVVHRNVTGNQRQFICDYAATTAAGSDTVATPLSVVDFVDVEFASTAALTTATICQAYPSTLAGSILVVTSTHDNLSIRYRVVGR